jgi:aminodeoxychorismate synthase component I
MMTHSSSAVTPLHPVKLDLSPDKVAESLQHLPNMVFFDTAGNLPSRSHPPISIVAARPIKILRGTIHNSQDLEQLRQSIAAYPPHSPSTGFPAGGACGWVDYEGDYCWGIYPEMLIYQHDRQQWWQCGNLTAALKTTHPAAENPSLLTSSFHPTTTQAEYEFSVRRIHEYIAAGDIYQANLTQRFAANVSGGSLFPLYQNLRTSSPAPLAAWMDLGGREILSSSPETFLRMRGKHIETRPIKGTRPRGSTEASDLALAKELTESSKENAELTMITDLQRNDIGQVCTFGSVRVAEMLALEKLEQVYHLVSTITGTLRNDVDHLDTLSACFPGGSITGAPKKRAMEIIAELEPVPRGLYTGALGYIGFNGESQFSIPIRTLVRENSTLSYHVGAGIVADSNPTAEYQETLDKAKGIRLAISEYFNRD